MSVSSFTENKHDPIFHGMAPEEEDASIVCCSGLEGLGWESLLDWGVKNSCVVLTI